MEAAINYYKFNIGDYAAATRHLTMLEHGAYRLLLDLYYTTEAPIPADLKEAVRRAGARTKEEEQAVETVLREFFEETAAGWIHRRCEQEIEAYQAKATTNRIVGKRGGRPKQETQTVSEKNPQETQTVSEKNPQETQTVSEKNPQETLTTNHKPINTPLAPLSGGRPARRKPRTALPDGFTPSPAGIELARSHGLDVQAELQRFVDHHTAAGSLMADWQAAWRTWIGKAVEFGRGRRNGASVSAVDRAAQDMAEPRPKWAIDAGFPNVFEARNAGCRESNAHRFRDGKAIEETV